MPGNDVIRRVMSVIVTAAIIVSITVVILTSVIINAIVIIRLRRHGHYNEVLDLHNRILRDNCSFPILWRLHFT